MTKEGFENWLGRAIDLAEDARKNNPKKLQDPIIFLMKSGRSVDTDLETLFDYTAQIDNSDNITVYPRSKGNFICEIDIDSIEMIKW